MPIFGWGKPDVREKVEVLEAHGVPVELREKLSGFIERAADAELYKVNPRYIAEQLGKGEHDTLGILAAAIYEGLFELNWEVHCPHCGGEARFFLSLQEAKAGEYCSNCKVDFDVHVDHEVHVSFTVSPAIRKIPPNVVNTDAWRDIREKYEPVRGLSLLNVRAFRELMAGQVLPDGESLKVKRVVILFTDLRGSTALYARRGDPRAYDLVRQHFEVLLDAADDNNGTTVKTIGDAVMASFEEPVDALQGALQAHRGIAQLNDNLNLSGDELLILKVGIHVGPCITVTLNGSLDYFGTAVNVAARVQGLSRGGDIVLTEAMLRDTQVQAELEQYERLETFEARLRGLDEHFLLHRLVVASQ